MTGPWCYETPVEVLPTVHPHRPLQNSALTTAIAVTTQFRHYLSKWFGLLALINALINWVFIGLYNWLTLTGPKPLFKQLSCYDYRGCFALRPSVMTCPWFDTQPLPGRWWCIVNWTTVINFNEILIERFPKLIIQGNTLGNALCKMAAILPKPQYAKTVIDCDFSNLLVLNGMNRNLSQNCFANIGWP